MSTVRLAACLALAAAALLGQSERGNVTGIVNTPRQMQVGLKLYW